MRISHLMRFAKQMNPGRPAGGRNRRATRPAYRSFVMKAVIEPTQKPSRDWGTVPGGPIESPPSSVCVAVTGDPAWASLALSAGGKLTATRPARILL
jgi:hypothetical protein